MGLHPRFYPTWGAFFHLFPLRWLEMLTLDSFPKWRTASQMVSRAMTLNREFRILRGCRSAIGLPLFPRSSTPPEYTRGPGDVVSTTTSEPFPLPRAGGGGRGPWTLDHILVENETFPHLCLRQCLNRNGKYRASCRAVHHFSPLWPRQVFPKVCVTFLG